MAAGNQKLVQLVVAGRDCGQWDSHDGGEVSYSNGKRRPGGMKPQRVSRGLGEFGDMTVERGWYPDEGDAALEKWIVAQGAAIAQIIVTDLDDFGYPLSGKQFARTYTGRVGQVTSPPSDSEDNDDAVWSVMVTVGSRS